VLPPVAVGYLLLLTLGRQGPVGRLLRDGLGVEIAFTWWAAVVASAVMGFPLMVRAVRLAVELVNPRLEEAARTLGASPFRVFCSVTLPLSLPGILTGMVLAFARSLGEFGATIAFAGNIEGTTRTLSLAIFTWTQVPGGDGPAIRLVVLSLALALAALIASEWLARLARRRLGAA
jgi:molybdate transport system permease protein